MRCLKICITIKYVHTVYLETAESSVNKVEVTASTFIANFDSYINMDYYYSELDRIYKNIP